MFDYIAALLSAHESIVTAAMVQPGATACTIECGNSRRGAILLRHKISDISWGSAEARQRSLVERLPDPGSRTRPPILAQRAAYLAAEYARRPLHTDWLCHVYAKDLGSPFVDFCQVASRNLPLTQLLESQRPDLHRRLLQAGHPRFNYATTSPSHSPNTAADSVGSDGCR